MADLINGWPEDGEPMALRPPVLRTDICNPGTPNEMIVERSDDIICKTIRAYGPITRWLLNTGWFDGIGTTYK
jgi:hypothetical protein